MPVDVNAQDSTNPTQVEPVSYLPTYDVNDPAASVDADADALITYITSSDEGIPRDPSSAPPTQNVLPLPLCLPQVSSGPTSLFVRAYNSALSDAGISMEMWLHFMDALNLAMAASPPLRVLNVAGMVIGVVPHWWFTVIGIGIQTVARAGMVIVAKTLSDRLLQRANAEIFAPRGLRVRLCRTAAVHSLVGLPGGGIKNKLKKVAHVAEKVVLRAPAVNKLYNYLATPVTPIVTSPSSSNADTIEYVNSVTLRRIADLEGHALPLTFTGLPAPAAPTTIMQRAQGMSVRLEQWQTRRAQTKVERKREKLAKITKGLETAEQQGRDRPPRNEHENNWVQHVREIHQVHRIEMDVRRAVQKKRAKKLKDKVEIADRLEYNTMQDLLWVVLLNEEQDKAIQGRELLDDPSSVEQIPEDEWNEELREEAMQVTELKKLEEEAVLVT